MRALWFGVRGRRMLEAAPRSASGAAKGENLMQLLRKLAPNALSLFMAVIFLDSLRYKFTNHPKTQEIFGRLDAWAG